MNINSLCNKAVRRHFDNDSIMKLNMAWWRHDVETLLSLLVMWEGNPLGDCHHEGLKHNVGVPWLLNNPKTYRWFEKPLQSCVVIIMQQCTRNLKSFTDVTGICTAIHVYRPIVMLCMHMIKCHIIFHLLLMIHETQLKAWCKTWNLFQWLYWHHLTSWCFTESVTRLFV